MSEQKEVYDQRQIKFRQFNKQYSEFAVKNSYPLIKNSTKLQKYLPSSEMEQGRYPDAQWYWGIVHTTLPEWADAYTEKVLANRLNQKPQNLNQEKIIKISDKWLEKLKQFDFQSKTANKKGRQSILIQQNVKPYRKREHKQDYKIDLSLEKFNEQLRKNLKQSQQNSPQKSANNFSVSSLRNSLEKSTNNKKRNYEQFQGDEQDKSEQFKTPQASNRKGVTIRNNKNKSRKLNEIEEQVENEDKQGYLSE